MAMLLACWRWLTAPADGLASPQARHPRARYAAIPAAPQRRLRGDPFFATLHAPLPRLLS